MNLLVWLMRAKRWAQHPLSLRRVLVCGAVIAAALALAGAEALWGWPAWLTVNRLRP